MRTPTAAYSTSVSVEEMSLCELIEIAKLDGTFIRACSLGAADVSFESNTYSGFPGFDLSDISFSAGEDPPSVDAAGPTRTLGPISFEDAASGLVEGCIARLISFDFESAAYHELGSKWYIGDIETDDTGKVKFDLRSLNRRNRQLALQTIQPTCGVDLGSSKCGVNLASFTETITVTSVIDALNLAVSGSTAGDGVYANGKIKFTSGNNQGVARAVRVWSNSPDIVTLTDPFPLDIQVGDTAEITRGCNKAQDSEFGCAGFSNQARFWGYRNLPDDELTHPNTQTEQTGTTTEPAGGGGVWYGGVATGGGFF